MPGSDCSTKNYHRAITRVEIINFIDLDKVIDIVDRETLWKIIRHYGIPNKYLSVILQGMTCRVIYSSDISEASICRRESAEGVFLFPFPVPSCYRLGDERENKRRAIWLSVDFIRSAGRFGFYKYRYFGSNLA